MRFLVLFGALGAFALPCAVRADEDADFPSGSPYMSEAQRMIADLVASGETDIDELVSIIAKDNKEKLDHIVINIAEQRIYECNVDGHYLHKDKVSSGAHGYDTPPGTYKVVNRARKAYSKKYDAWMLNWMGLTSNGDYGMHGLEGSSYERLLGNVASHGCVRLSRAYAKELYERVSEGMPVKIINDPELKMIPYEPLSHNAAVAVVLDVLSPADPSEIFY
jgi:lipoprotein-anchoring transpeptidase ErfK/SrfK